MTEKGIVEILNYPDAAIVEFAVGRANLTGEEREVISLRVHDNLTIEAAAERLEVSDTTIKRRYRSGMAKLDLCWSGIPIFEYLAHWRNT